MLGTPFLPELTSAHTETHPSLNSADFLCIHCDAARSRELFLSPKPPAVSPANPVRKRCGSWAGHG